MPCETGDEGGGPVRGVAFGADVPRHMGEEEEIPAPPCRFRCNRSRMLLTIRVTLHHISGPQINLKTSRKKIELDTMQ
jgi:hypothetical protein